MEILIKWIPCVNGLVTATVLTTKLVKLRTKYQLFSLENKF